ncbi:MAG: ABC transporter permease [Brooklawnia sp.]|jgi:ABC-2 type transport system permease protein
MILNYPASEFSRPGAGAGLLDVVRNRYLLKLLVGKELRVRYRGSILGMLWSYVKPAVQFLVFFFAVGIFLGMNQRVENFPVYLFSGIIAINFFNEAFGNATRSIVENAPLVKKIYLPRELFSASSLIVAAIHFFPQVVVLMLGALVTGWRPTIPQLLGGVLGFVILATFSLGLGLLFGAVNVIVRDAQNIVDLIAMVVNWTSPVLYHWEHVMNALGPGIGWTIYQLNPITPVVELFHWCFWSSTASDAYQPPPGMVGWVVMAAVTSIIVLIIGELVFRRLDGRFAQEL